MTIPKNAGLSRLAEAASPIEYYPVKRRGQKRRLLPNWDAINRLERETEGDTEISDVRVLGAYGEWAEMNGVRALGWYGAKRSGHYPRRMFDVFELETSSSNTISYPDPCPDCLDFSRTWACEEHPELPWDTEKRQFVRPGRESRSSQPPPLDPPVGTVEGQPVTIDQVAQQDEMTAEWERQNHVSLAEAISRMSAGVNPFGPTRRDFLATLPDFSITIEGTFDPGILEITGETVQSASSTTERDGIPSRHTVRIEVE